MANPSKTPTTPATSTPPTLQKSTSGSQSGQKSIKSFFQKRAGEGQRANVTVQPTLPPIPPKVNGTAKKIPSGKTLRGSSQSLTPAPSSDAIEPGESEEAARAMIGKSLGANGLPSPITPVGEAAVKDAKPKANGLPLLFDSPSRKVSLSHPISDEMSLIRIYRQRKSSTTPSLETKTRTKTLSIHLRYPEREAGH